MNETQSCTPNALEGLDTRAETAKKWDCCEHTIAKWERAGLPVIKVGKFRYYRQEAVRAWILSHEQTPRAPQRGRPRKLATAA